MGWQITQKNNYFYNNLKKTNIENKIPELVQNNLTRSGLFFALDKKSFIQKPEVAHNKPRFEDWSFIKAQVLVTGKISLEELHKRSKITPNAKNRG